ncbi:Oxoglutarate/iron-dependent dioxygenase [Macleaya cordata]|uniref:2-oxoglutarate-dependent dioxygenase DAO n=1 Tax=Macleaya cordata TaxID=56857 RepID=A0A200PN73_MACCD|nr:Oxoglutarate/iron-dependent dioxygenase [Macleaya cordata]
MDLESGILCVDLSKDPKDLEEGSEGWKNLCKKVREACEEYGCFQVVYEKIPVELYEEMVMALRDLFDLPVETKQKNKSSKQPYSGYIGKADVVPLYESLGIEDAPILDMAQAFTDLMWPNGNPAFCKTINRMSQMVLELELLIRKMVFESYGIENYYDSNVKNSQCVLRVIKYDAPRHSDDDSTTMGLLSHTDKNILTVLYQQDLPGLEVLSKEGDEWFQVSPRHGTFTVLVGETLKALSNGRAHAVKHRVILRISEKERYSYGLFSAPKEDVMVEVPKELVDKDHPLLYRPFNYVDFFRFFYQNYTLENVLEVYAGVVVN